jgi:hypothetical protein
MGKNKELIELIIEVTGLIIDVIGVDKCQLAWYRWGLRLDFRMVVSSASFSLTLDLRLSIYANVSTRMVRSS